MLPMKRMKTRSPTLACSAITALSSHLTTMAPSQAAIVVSTLPWNAFQMHAEGSYLRSIDNYSMFFFQTFSPLPPRTLLIYHLRKRYPVAYGI